MVQRPQSLQKVIGLYHFSQQTCLLVWQNARAVIQLWLYGSTYSAVMDNAAQQRRAFTAQLNYFNNCNYICSQGVRANYLQNLQIICRFCRYWTSGSTNRSIDRSIDPKVSPDVPHHASKYEKCLAVHGFCLISASSQRSLRQPKRLCEPHNRHFVTTMKNLFHKP